MKKPTPLPCRPVDMRACPKCGYMIANLVATALRISMSCPACREHHTDEFQPIMARRPRGDDED